MYKETYHQFPIQSNATELNTTQKVVYRLTHIHDTFHIIGQYMKNDWLGAAAAFILARTRERYVVDGGHYRYVGTIGRRRVRLQPPTAAAAAAATTPLSVLDY